MRMLCCGTLGLIAGLLATMLSATTLVAGEVPGTPASTAAAALAPASIAPATPLIRLGRPVPLRDVPPPLPHSPLPHSPLPHSPLHSTFQIAQPTPISDQASVPGSSSQASFRPVVFQRVNWGDARPTVRAQAADIPPPPPPPVSGGPFGGPGAAVGKAGEEAYNCGVVTGQPGGGFFHNFWDNCKQWWADTSRGVGGAFQPGPGHGIFQSDHHFDSFISPVSNPFLFEDPRALTELKPVFIWQSTPSSNHIFGGGDNFFFGLQARLAVYERLSFVINKLGFVSINPEKPFPEFADSTGFAEFWIGPKYTFIRNPDTGTLLAAGLTFQIPTGPRSVFQDTGSLSLDPYVSFGQQFWKTSYGTFNFLTTAGYALRVNDDRTDYFHASLHLSYDVGNLHRIYPLLELNWLHYTFSGHTRDIGFEGRDLFNFGSQGASGHGELTLALGARYKFSEAIQLGVAAEFSLIGGSRHLDDFRLTVDMIFRY